MKAAIEIDHASKIYRRYPYRRRFSTLKSAIVGRKLLGNIKNTGAFTAVNQISLSVAQGSAFGIIGRNGSGKSTLLKLVAGITKPTSGQVRVNGRVSALIELGAGFHPEISGRENVFVNGVMLGLSKREVAERFDAIVEFAEIEKFIDAPVKTYSSGMYMRLGFAVAVHVDPDILIVDEVLAVGDEGFNLKCLDKFAEFKRQGKTIILVSHGLPIVEQFCDEAIWLDHGKMRAHGDPRRVVADYLTDVQQSEEKLLSSEDQKVLEASQIDSENIATTLSNSLLTVEEPPADMFRSAQGRWGSGEVKIINLSMENEEGPSHVFHTGMRMTIRIRVSAPKLVDDFVFGVSVFNAEGVCCYGTNTDIEAMVPETMVGDGEVIFNIEQLNLVEGTYKLDAAIHTRDGRSYDYHRLLYTFRVKSSTKDVGIYRPPHRWEFTPNICFRKP